MSESGTSFISKVGASPLYDDRIDTNTELTSVQAGVLIGRCFGLLAEVRWMFTAKFVLSTGIVIPMLLMPWMGKILTDNVLLQRPFGETDVRYPPYMEPLVAHFSSMEPLQIMGYLTAMFCVMLILMGWRMGGVWPQLLGDADAATQAENELSQGGSDGGGVWGLVEFWINVRLTQRIANTLRTRLLGNLIRLPMTTLGDQRIGDSLYRVLYDSAVVPRMCYELTMEPFLGILIAMVNLYLINYTYGAVLPEVVWVAWAMLPISFLVTFPMSRLMRRVNQNKRAAGTATTNAMEEAIDNIDAVQSLGGMTRESERFAGRSRESFLRERYAMAVSILLSVTFILLSMTGGVYVVLLVSDKIIEGAMTPGDFFVLFGIYQNLFGAAVTFGALWISVQEPIAAVRRVFFFLDHESDEDQAGGRPLPPIEQGVDLDHVFFVYPGGHQALSDVSLSLPVGRLTAIVGPSGSGKTTLAYLIPAVLRPTSGRVTIDGQDLRETDLDSLRSQVAYVMQEHMLLSQSIRENLLLANPGASEDQIVEALRMADCLEFVERLPDGIDTELTRGGNTLSVGQQQRLCIARGLVRDARILILDEPTAALDPETENALVDTLVRASEERLIVVIAHRLSTIRRADQVVFLEEGKVRDVGTHTELMADPDSAYGEFVRLQHE
ncbi:MAG: ABC transporter ATP-binding protein [Gammaproteobacteria bacterium]|nr:ABC transporter ATP-binding protein [Gammaproteobacteria bacterium]